MPPQEEEESGSYLKFRLIASIFVDVVICNMLSEHVSRDGLVLTVLEPAHCRGNEVDTVFVFTSTHVVIVITAQVASAFVVTRVAAVRVRNVLMSYAVSAKLRCLCPPPL